MTIGPQITGAIDQGTKDAIIAKLRALKEEAMKMEAKVNGLEEDNKKLNKQKAGLEYRVEHMKKALEQYMQKK